MQLNLAPVPKPAKERRIVALFLPMLVFATICLARIVYVSLYASPLPFWDQWDELDRQIRPWFNNNWHFVQLFAPHGEHRIAFTRGISLLLAVANDHVFDNLVEAYANAFIYALLWAVLCALLVRHDTSNHRPWLIALGIMALGVLPFDWENTLIGFQNQFYLMELFAVVGVGIAAYRSISLGTVISLAILALASVFTMGSGLLMAPAVCVAVLLRAWREPTQRRYTFSALIAMVVVAAFGLVLLLHSREHGVLHAHHASQLITALIVSLIWPLQHPLQVSHWLFAGMLWTPSVIWAIRFLKNRRNEADEVFAIALAVWVLLQCLAIAYARGHDMRFLSSRYSEIPAIGIAANAWLALKLVSQTRAWKRLVFGAALVCGTALVGWAFWRRTPGDLLALQQRHAFTTVETSNVRHYLAGRPLPLLPEGSLDLPYPSAARLRNLLDSAEIRALLPPAVFPSFDFRHPAPLSSFAVLLQRSIRGWFPNDVWTVDVRAVATAPPATFHAYISLIPDHAGNPQCSLDAIDGKPAAGVDTIDRDTVVIFQGWAGNGESRPVGKGLFILKGTHDAYAARFANGVKRPDVAKALHNEAMVGAGFNLMVAINHIPAGTYSLFVASPNDSNSACELHRVLTVQ